MQQHAVDAVAGQLRALLVESERLQDLPHLVMVGGRCCRQQFTCRRPDLALIEQGAQCFDAFALDGHCSDDRHPERRRQGGRVQHQAAPGRQVSHVQHDDAGQAQALDRQHQAQIAAQIGCVEHADDQVRALFAAGTTGQYIAGDSLIGRAGMQAVGAWQIEQAQRLACSAEQTPFLAFDGHAGVVGDLLVAAGQAIEKGGLAAVRVAHQRHQGAAAVHMDDCFTQGRLPDD